jgi:hypothetical protein
MGPVPKRPQAHLRGLAAQCVRAVQEFRPKRAWGMPGANRTRSLACKIKKHTSVVTTGKAGFTRHSRTQWF